MAHTCLLDVTDGYVWTSDSPLHISFLKGSVITAQIDCNSALGSTARKGKRREEKHTPCVARQLHSVGASAGCWGTAEDWLCCKRAARSLEMATEGTDFMLCLWQMQLRKHSSRGHGTKVATSPLCRVTLSRCMGCWRIFGQLQSGLVKIRAPWDTWLCHPQIWSWHKDLHSLCHLLPFTSGRSHHR